MNLNGNIPYRGRSEPVKEKDIKPFSGFEVGPIEVKLRQPQKVNALDEITISTSNPVVPDFTSNFGARVVPLSWHNTY